MNAPAVAGDHPLCSCCAAIPMELADCAAYHLARVAYLLRIPVLDWTPQTRCEHPAETMHRTGSIQRCLVCGHKVQQNAGADPDVLRIAAYVRDRMQRGTITRD